VRRRSWLALALIAPLLFAGCGGDDEPASEEVKKPELTVPQDETSDSATDTSTDTTETDDGTGSPDAPLDQQNPGNGGTPAPDSNNPPPPRDSPQNDTPPEPGSPAERFEQFCAQNPGAC
jgi:hypothetical protein